MKNLVLIAAFILPNFALAQKPVPLNSYVCIVNGSGKVQVFQAVSTAWAREMAADAQTKDNSYYGGDGTGRTRPVAVEQVACALLYAVDAQALRAALGDQLFKE